MTESRVTRNILVYDQEVYSELKRRLSQHQLDTLYHWTLLADREHLPILREIKQIVEEVQTLTPPSCIYRGMGLSGSFQETLGLYKKGLFGSRILTTVHVGMEFSRHLLAPLSMTTDITIARAFGKLVIRYDVKDLTNLFILTPELCILRNTYARIKNVYETQDEVVLLPSIKPYEFAVIERP